MSNALQWCRCFPHNDDVQPLIIYFVVFAVAVKIMFVFLACQRIVDSPNDLFAHNSVAPQLKLLTLNITFLCFEASVT